MSVELAFKNSKFMRKLVSNTLILVSLITKIFSSPRCYVYKDATEEPFKLRYKQNTRLFSCNLVAEVSLLSSNSISVELAVNPNISVP